MKTIEEIQNQIENSPFDHWIGMKVVEYSAGFCAVEVTIRKEHKNIWDIVHGGILFSLCDAVSAFASSYGQQTGSVTQSAAIHFFRPANGDKLRVEGRLIHRNDKIAHADGCVLDEEGKTLAECMFEHHFSERFQFPEK